MQATCVIENFLVLKGGFPGGSMVKNPPASAEDAGLISGAGRSPGEGNGNSPQYPCLGNPMDRGAWEAIVCDEGDPGVDKGGDVVDGIEF